MTEWTEKHSAEAEVQGFTVLNKEEGFPSVPNFLKGREDDGDGVRGLLIIAHSPGHKSFSRLLVGDVNTEGGVCDCCTDNFFVRAYKQLDIPPRFME